MYRVKDLDQSVKFYTDVLGLKVRWTDKNRQMTGLCFAEYDTEIVLTSDLNMPDFDLVYLVENVAKFCTEYKNLGYKVQTEPFDVRCGKYAVIEDIDDHLLPIIDLTAFGGKARYGEF